MKSYKIVNKKRFNRFLGILTLIFIAIATMVTKNGTIAVLLIIPTIMAIIGYNVFDL